MRDPAVLEAMLKRCARQSIPQAVSMIVAAKVRKDVGNIDVKPKNTHGDDANELEKKVVACAEAFLGRSKEHLSKEALHDLVLSTYSDIDRSFESEAWKSLVPGKEVLSRFANAVGIALPRLKSLYVHQTISDGDDCFSDVIEIFEEFSKV